jgi:transposase
MSLQKFKVKEQFAQIKAQFESQKSGIPVQSQMLFSMMVQFVELLIMVMEEKFTKKTPKNSSIPPSRGHWKNKSRGKNSKKIANLPDPLVLKSPDEVFNFYPEFCQDCGLDLSAEASKGFDSRQVLDIVVEQHVIDYRVHQKDCPCCSLSQVGRFPKGIIAPIQYGPTIRALAISMLYAQMSSYSRTQVMLMELVGRSLSQATIVGFVRCLYKKLENWEHWAREKLLASPLLHADETGFNLNGGNAWIHVLSNDEVVLMNCHLKRGNEAIDEIGIVPKFKGILVHDFWQAYYQYEGLAHAACGAHLLRELEFIIEAHDQKWAKLMHKILLDALALVESRAKGKLLELEYKIIQKRYRAAVKLGGKECPQPLSKGKRGRVAKTKAGNLLDRFKKYEQEILKFAEDSLVPFTNNLAERDLRMVKVKQNVSGFFRSDEGAKSFCRIRSYLLSSWRKGIPPIQALKLAIEGDGNYE